MLTGVVPVEIGEAGGGVGRGSDGGSGGSDSCCCGGGRGGSETGRSEGGDSGFGGVDGWGGGGSETGGREGGESGEGSVSWTLTTGGEEMDVVEITLEISGSDLFRRALKSSTVRSVMFCWMMAVEDGFAVVATSRMVSATSGSRISHVITTSSGGLK